MAGNQGTSRRGLIQLSDIAKQHPLFPMLDYIARSEYQQSEAIAEINRELEDVKRMVIRISDAQAELQILMQKVSNETFDLDRSGFKSQLRVRTAGLFCESITREISDDAILKITRAVLQEASKDHHKLQVSMKFVKHLAVTFKSEERRRVLGKPQCQKLAKLSTQKLTEAIMGYLKAPHSKMKVYKDNLTIMRKYVREYPECKDHAHFHVEFSKWLKSKYPPNGNPSPDELKLICHQDEEFDYAATAQHGSQIESEDIEEFMAPLDEDDVTVANAAADENRM